MENLDKDLCAYAIAHWQCKQSESQCAQHHLQRAQTKGILCQCLHFMVDNSELRVDELLYDGQRHSGANW